MSRIAKTREIGSGGLTFSTPREITPGGCMEFVTTLMEGKRTVRIRCRGIVLRVVKEETDGEATFHVTVTIDRYEFLRSPQPALTAVTPALTPDVAPGSRPC